MKILFLLPIILLVFFIPQISPEIYSQSQDANKIENQLNKNISVQTDKPHYVNGDIIIIKGIIENYDSEKFTYLIKSPSNNMVSLGQIYPHFDGSFEKTFVAGGSLWKLSGDYTLQLHHGADSGEVIINYVGGEQVITAEYNFSDLPKTCVGCSMEEQSTIPHRMLIKTADNDLTVPGCLETEVGCYTPKTTTVEVGGVVTMTNSDETGIHTFTSGTVDGFAATADGTFDSGILQFGNSFQWIPDTPGEYPYYCMLHVWMQGTIIVGEGTVPDIIFITVQTDKPSYSKGEIIRVTGKVSEILEGYIVSSTVISPNGSLVSIDQLIVGANKKFSTSLDAGGLLIKDDGTYTVTAQYGDSVTDKVKTTFEFVGGEYVIPTNPKPDTTLQQENTQLKLENKKLKNQINELQLKIDNLQNIINEQIQVIMDVLMEFKSR